MYCVWIIHKPAFTMQVLAVNNRRWNYDNCPNTEHATMELVSMNVYSLNLCVSGKRLQGIQVTNSINEPFYLQFVIITLWFSCMQCVPLSNLWEVIKKMHYWWAVVGKQNNDRPHYYSFPYHSIPITKHKDKPATLNTVLFHTIPYHFIPFHTIPWYMFSETTPSLDYILWTTPSYWTTLNCSIVHTGVYSSWTVPSYWTTLSYSITLEYSKLLHHTELYIIG